MWAWRVHAPPNRKGMQDGGDEAADRRRSARSDQGGSRHRHACPARGWRASGSRTFGRRGEPTGRCAEIRRRRRLSRVLQAAVTVATAAGPSPLRDHVTGARGSGVLVDFVVVSVRPDRVRESPEARDGHRPVADAGAAELGPFVPGGLSGLLACYRASGKAGEETEVPADLGTALGRRVAGGRTAVAAVPRDASPEEVQAFAEGVLLGSYRYTTDAADSADVRRGTVRLLISEPCDLAGLSAAADRAATVAGAVALARDLVNTPSARKSPHWLAERAIWLADRGGLQVRVRRGDELAAAGFGGIAAV